MVGLLRLTTWLILIAGAALALAALPGQSFDQKLACLGLSLPDADGSCAVSTAWEQSSALSLASAYFLGGAVCALFLGAFAVLLRTMAQMKDALERLAVIAEAEDTLQGEESERVLASEITESSDGTFEVGGRTFREQESAEQYKQLIKIRTE